MFSSQYSFSGGNGVGLCTGFVSQYLLFGASLPLVSHYSETWVSIGIGFASHNHGGGKKRGPQCTSFACQWIVYSSNVLADFLPVLFRSKSQGY